MKRKKPVEIPRRSQSIEIACPYCVNRGEDRLPLTQEPLGEFKCPVAECKCTVVMITPSCHPNSPVETYYCKQHGTMSLFCAECGELSAVLAIAREVDHISEEFWAAMYLTRGGNR